jgi:rhodanese-related sulfurtransferase
MTVNAIDAFLLKHWLDHDEAVLIDVREPDEYQKAHISGSILIPLATLTQQSLPELKERKLVFQCHSGKRSLTACEKISAAIPSLDVYNLQGGIVAWYEHYPIEQGV